MREESCCFSGHRSVPYELGNQLTQRIKGGINYLHDNMSITTYYTGGALGFDSLAAEAVIDQRKDHPDIRLVLVIP